MLKRSLLAFVVAGSALAIAPGNDKCIQSELLQPAEQVRSDNSLANHDYVAQGICGARSDRAALWYEIKGNGGEISVSVCTNNEVITDFGVFPECNSQECVGAPPQLLDPSNCDEGVYVTYSFRSRRLKRYFIQVRADVIDGVGTDFNITYNVEGGDPPTEAPVEEEKPRGKISPSAAVGLSSMLVLGISGLAMLLM